MLLRKRKRTKMGVRQPSQLRSLQHLRFVRGHECAIQGKIDTGVVPFRIPHICRGPIQACHVRTATDGGTGVKPSDNFTTPLCADAHAEQHQIGEPAFEKRYGIDMRKIADALWARSPVRVRMERKFNSVPARKGGGVGSRHAAQHADSLLVELKK